MLTMPLTCTLHEGRRPEERQRSTSSNCLNGVPLPFDGEHDLASIERLREGLPVVSVHQDDPPGVTLVDEPNKFVVPSMGREVKLLPLAPDLHVRASEFDDPLVHESPA